MESGYVYDSLTELPPLPQEFSSRNYFSSAIVTTPPDSLPPFPPSDFTPFSVNNKDRDDSFLLDSVSPLSLLTESTQLQNLFPIEVTPFLHMPKHQSLEQSTPMKPYPCLSLSPPSDKTQPKSSDSPSLRPRRLPHQAPATKGRARSRRKSGLCLHSQIAALESVYSTAGKGSSRRR